MRRGSGRGKYPIINIRKSIQQVHSYHENDRTNYLCLCRLPLVLLLDS